MNLLLLGLLGFLAYKATSSSSASTTASNGTTVSLPGVTIPAGVRLTSTDVAVARAILNPANLYVDQNGVGYTSAPTTTVQYFGFNPSTDPGARLAILNNALNVMGTYLARGITMRLFDAVQ
jgi:hypothetical protein